jgi:hypothetical protein
LVFIDQKSELYSLSEFFFFQYIFYDSDNSKSYPNEPLHYSSSFVCKKWISWLLTNVHLIFD